VEARKLLRLGAEAEGEFGVIAVTLRERVAHLSKRFDVAARLRERFGGHKTGARNS
jgi:hypothetical protein